MLLTNSTQLAVNVKVPKHILVACTGALRQSVSRSVRRVVEICAEMQLTCITAPRPLAPDLCCRVYSNASTVCFKTYFSGF